MLPPAERSVEATGQLRGYCAAMEPPRELLLAQAIYVLHRRRVAIVSCALAGLLAGLLYVLIRQPRYEASAEIEVTPASTNGLGLDELAAKALSPNDSTTRLQAAVQVLRSNSLAVDVIEQLSLAQNRTFAGGWQQREGAGRAEWSPQVRDHLLARFRKGLSVDVVPKSDVLAIKFAGRSPEMAAQVVNTVVRKFRERSLRTSYESANEVSEWLSRQLGDLKQKARQSQEELATLERSSGLLGQDETDNIVFEKLKQIDEALTGLESDRIVKEARFRIAASGDPELLATSAPDATLQVLRTQQAGLRLQYAQLSSKFGNGYPKLQEVAEQITAVDAAVDRQLKELTQRYRNDYEAAVQSEQMLRASFEGQKQKAYRLNEGAAQHAILKHEVESTQQLYETLQLKLKQAGIAAGLASASIEVIDEAQAPSEPAEPKPLPSTLVGLGAGLVFGLGAALALESADDTVRSTEEVEQATSLPLLGTVPQLGRSGRLFAHGTRRRFVPADRAVMLHNPISRAAESYRTVCNSLLLASRTEQPKVITVTSAMALEGKTTTAINTAVALAQQGAKVLLVDGDLRQPAVHSCFAIPQQPGLVDCLASADRPESLPSEVPQQPGLWVLPAGIVSGDKSPMLDGKAMSAVLERWRGRYDRIVIDAPPVSLVSDAVVLASQSDAVVLVVRCEATSRRVLRHTYGTLLRTNAKVVGFVLNAVETGPWYQYRYPSGGSGRRAEDAYYAHEEKS